VGVLWRYVGDSWDWVGDVCGDSRWGFFDHVLGHSIWDWFVVVLWGPAADVLEKCWGQHVGWRWRCGGTVCETGLEMCLGQRVGLVWEFIEGEQVGLGWRCVGDRSWDWVGNMLICCWWGWVGNVLGITCGTWLEMCVVDSRWARFGDACG
jgi:hypothetical protein